ncbi:MAG: ABC transporter permease [Gaiellaceae bacterium]
MRWILRRISFYLIAFWAAITINFALPRLMPGSPLTGVIQMIPPNVLQSNPGIIKELMLRVGGGNEPIWKQYPRYLLDMATFNFGLSTSFQVPVSEVIRQALPWTIFLVGVGVILAFVIGTTLGVFAAWRRGKFIDTIFTPGMMVFQSFPPFFLALLLVYFLGLKGGWFPIQHSFGNNGNVHGPNWPFLSDVIRHAELPLIALVLTGAGGWLIGMRNVMINTIAEDYITLAQAKGLTDRRVMWRYGARNAVLPPLTGFATVIGLALGGQILIELVFSYPGVGFMITRAATGHDYPLLQALLLIFVLAVLVSNLIMDFIYVLLDPRVRTG